MILGCKLRHIATQQRTHRPAMRGDKVQGWDWKTASPGRSHLGHSAIPECPSSWGCWPETACRCRVRSPGEVALHLPFLALPVARMGCPTAVDPLHSKAHSLHIGQHQRRNHIPKNSQASLNTLCRQSLDTVRINPFQSNASSAIRSIAEAGRKEFQFSVNVDSFQRV